MASSSGTALKTFSLTNDVLEISPQDEIYRFDKAETQRIIREAPWAQEYASRVA
jgi:COP9 signalosome complex subunit 5